VFNEVQDKKLFTAAVKHNISSC